MSDKNFPATPKVIGWFYPHFLCYLNPSLPMILFQIKMYPVSFLPVFICKISRFDPFCIPQHLSSDSVFCFVWTSCFWTPLRISTSPFGLPFCFIERIGLTFGFDSLPVTRITNWIISVETVCWEKRSRFWTFTLLLVCLHYSDLPP